jgi:hypothetical protein
VDTGIYVVSWHTPQPLYLLFHTFEFQTNNQSKNASRAVIWLRHLVASLSPRRPGLAPGLVHMGLLADRVSLGQVFLRLLLSFPINVITRGSPHSCIIWGRTIGPLVSAVHRHSHPIGMNNTNSSNEPVNKESNHPSSKPANSSPMKIRPTKEPPSQRTDCVNITD